MPHALVAIVTSSADRRGHFVDRLRSLQATRPALQVAFETDGLLIATEGYEQQRLGHEDGLVIGRLVASRAHAPVAAIAAAEAEAVVASRGRHLVEHYWGGYVAIIAPPRGTIDIIRAPLGDLPCYIHQRRDALLFSSSARLLALCGGVEPRPVWPALARHLAFGHLRTSETCLGGIEELRGGERLSISADLRCRSSLWSPWTAAAQKPEIVDPVEAAARVAATTRTCVAASLAAHERIVLKLSGGLDSSIVAACLSDSAKDYSCLTLVTDDASGDERVYARAVARHLQAPLVEAYREPLRFDLMRPPARDLPRPSIPGFRQESDRLTAEVAQVARATAVVDGGGGDNVFCSLQSAAPVADCLLDRRGLRWFKQTASSIAEIAHVSTLHVMRRAAQRAWGGRRDHRWPPDLQFLSADAIASVPPAPFHPWLRSPNSALPGRAAHVALIVAAQSYVEGVDPDRDPPLIVPLLAQPLVELCLTVQSWLWFDRGLNRAAARRAFASELPAAITSRRTKGSPDAFIVQILEHNLASIRDLLLDGLLAREGLVDRRALAAALEDWRPASDSTLHRIMGLLDAEIWARGWHV